MTVQDRFLKYVSYPTMSDENSATTPSTQKQLLLGNQIVQDLKEAGLSNVYIDKYGYVWATLKATDEAFHSTIGFIAHMDTSSEASDENIVSKIVCYDGNDIVLNEEKNIILSNKTYPSLNNYVGQHLIVTNGTTLLGADDKAGIAEIITAIQHIKEQGYPHGTIKIAFTPDEEIGRGADFFDVKGFNADYAYTVDGGRLGELEYENFNAASVTVRFHGVSIHPGSAKGIMKNAALMACEFNELLPENEIPSMTENYEGFHHLTGITGGIEYAELSYIIRDHDRNKFENKKLLFEKLAYKMQERYGKELINIDIKDSYYNMREVIEQHIEIVEYVKNAMHKANVKPIIQPIRGGTDGARLSYMGLPCPNICTGGENFHSRFEYISIESMEKVVQIIENIIIDAH